MTFSDAQVLGDEAEGIFEQWARRAPFDCARLEPDRYGIDRWFELPSAAPSAISLDRRSGGLQGYVQIKGTRNLSKGTDIALSVWDRFVKCDLPCFVICIHFDDALGVLGAYFSHVGPGRMPAILKRLRSASADDLHKKTHRQKWTPSNAMREPLAEDFVRRVRDQIGDHTTYAARKATIRSTSGYHPGGRQLRVRPRAGDDEIIAALLDGREIPIDIVSATETRFGIELPDHEVPTTGDFTMKIGPSESRAATLAITTPQARTTINGEVRLAGVTRFGLPANREVVRFEAPALRLDLRNGQTSTTIGHVGLERLDELFTLRDLRNATNMIVNYVREGRSITIDMEGHPLTIDGGVLDSNPVEILEAAITFRWAAAAVEAAGLPDDVRVRPREILSQADELRNWGVHTDRDARVIMTVVKGDFSVDEFTTVLPAWVSVGRHIVIQAFASEAVPIPHSDPKEPQFRLTPLRSGRAHVVELSAALDFDPVSITIELREELQKERPLLALDDGIRSQWTAFIAQLSRSSAE